MTALTLADRLARSAALTTALRDASSEVVRRDLGRRTVRADRLAVELQLATAHRALTDSVATARAAAADFAALNARVDAQLDRRRMTPQGMIPLPR